MRAAHGITPKLFTSTRKADKFASTSWGSDCFEGLRFKQMETIAMQWTHHPIRAIGRESGSRRPCRAPVCVLAPTRLRNRCAPDTYASAWWNPMVQHPFQESRRFAGFPLSGR